MSAQEQGRPAAHAAEAMVRDYERLQQEVNANVAQDGTGLQHDQVPYAQVPNLVAFSTYLSDGAKSTLVTLIALPRGWQVSAERLERFKLEKVAAIETSLRELRRFGFYRVERWQAERGRWNTRSLVSRTPRRDWAEDAEVYGDRPIPMVRQADGTFVQVPPDAAHFKPWEGKRPDPADRLSTGSAPTTSTDHGKPVTGGSERHNPRSDRPSVTEGRSTEGRSSEDRRTDPRSARGVERPTTKTTYGDSVGEFHTREAERSEPVDDRRGERGAPRRGPLLPASMTVPDHDPDDPTGWVEALRSGHVRPLSGPSSAMPDDLARRRSRSGPSGRYRPTTDHQEDTGAEPS